MAELTQLVDLVNQAGGAAALPAAATASGLVALGAWRLWAPRRDALPPLAPALPPSVGQAARPEAGAGPDAALLGLQVPGGGE